MSQIPSETTFFEGPCTYCEYKTDCTVYPELRNDLYVRPGFQLGDTLDGFDELMDEISQSWIQSIATIYQALLPEDINASLSALFDTLCSALYARDVLSLDARTREITGLRCRDELIFPYTWMCPRCVSRGLSRDDCYLPDAVRKTEKGVTRDFPDITLLAKPRSRAIGDVGIKVLRSILRVVLKIPPVKFKMSEGGGRRGEFDLTFASIDTLLFGEVKAKPLIAFPLIVREFGKPTTVASHQWVKPKTLPGARFSLYVAAANDLFIDVGSPLPETPYWPLEAVAKAAKDPLLVQSIVIGWRRHLDAYRTWTNEPDQLRWHRFGCGNFSTRENGVRIERRVANTKELPGLDRTDDIKKGASQVLLFSRFKQGCKKEALKSSLLGNVYAETHGANYLDRLANMRVTAEGYQRLEWIFDMILGLSRNIFNDPILEETFDVKSVIIRAAQRQKKRSPKRPR